MKLFTNTTECLSAIATYMRDSGNADVITQFYRMTKAMTYNGSHTPPNGIDDMAVMDITLSFEAAMSGFASEFNLHITRVAVKPQDSGARVLMTGMFDYVPVRFVIVLGDTQDSTYLPVTVELVTETHGTMDARQEGFEEMFKAWLQESSTLAALPEATA